MDRVICSELVVCFYPRLRAVQTERTAVQKDTSAVTSGVRKAPG